jgi:hypothetical protein
MSPDGEAFRRYAKAEKELFGQLRTASWCESNKSSSPTKTKLGVDRWLIALHERESVSMSTLSLEL